MGAEHSGSKVDRGDEAAEQAIVVEVPRKSRDAAPAGQVASFPVGTGRFIEMGSDEIFVEANIAVVVCSAKEAIERGVRRQALSGGELQFQKCDMRLVEIDSI